MQFIKKIGNLFERFKKELFLIILGMFIMTIFLFIVTVKQGGGMMFKCDEALNNSLPVKNTETQVEIIRTQMSQLKPVRR